MRHLMLGACLIAVGCAPPAAENEAEAPAAANETAPAPPAPQPPPALVTAEIPGAFHGRWDRSRAACERPGEYRLELGGDRIRLYESEGSVTRVAVEAPRTIAVTADYRGEGRSWSETRRLTLSDDGHRLTVESGGAGVERVRCAEEAGAPAGPGGAGWQVASSGEGTGLSFSGSAGKRLATLFCPAGRGTLLVNIASFRPVGSEERMSFGAGGTVVALVADTAGDKLRGGVSGEGPVPAELAEIVGAQAGLSVNYGAQNAGPFAPVPADAARSFVRGCTD